MTKCKTLLVVESPAKAKTIKKYLGPGFDVLASYGHVRDLVAKEGAVAPDHAFAMRYEAIEKNAKHVDAIARSLRTADQLFLATDPDREGEAIAWHLRELLVERGVLGNKPVKRVVFHEITQQAIRDAVANPGELAHDLINAQQARRALDYLVGFNISPLLWKKIRPGLSAGRVQSPALRLIVDREGEIEAFIAQEYWTIQAVATSQEGGEFSARLVELRSEKLEQFSLANELQAYAARDAVIGAALGKLDVLSVQRKARQRQPSPPFITSTLQQEASRRVGFTAQRTMRIAQQLYEGVAIGEDGPVGLISYMRTDSVTLATEALTEIRQLIGSAYGSEYVPDQPRTYRTKSKNAQEAHEAIRPTSVFRQPSALAQYLTAEQLKLYALIWRRTVASQMNPAVMDTVAIELGAGSSPIGRLRANGSTVRFKGFLAAYDDREESESAESKLPVLNEGEQVNVRDIEATQHFTEAPPRYTEATLIKALEEFGIGRPSTYASIISTLQQREYVRLDEKRFKPTDVGRVVSRFLTEHFQRYVDYDFTAKLEDELDAVSRGEKAWIPVLEGFWEPFHQRVLETASSVSRRDVVQQILEEACPICAKPLARRLGRRGSFIGCTGYPECSYTRDAGEGVSASAPTAVIDHPCPLCGGELSSKAGRFGAFVGCKNYPACKHVEPLHKPKDTNIRCPECSVSNLFERKSRKGGFFYSCGSYPTCKYAVWAQPIAEVCPLCGHGILTLKTTKRDGTKKVCPRKECSFSSAPLLPDETVPP